MPELRCAPSISEAVHCPQSSPNDVGDASQFRNALFQATRKQKEHPRRGGQGYVAAAQGISLSVSRYNGAETMCPRCTKVQDRGCYLPRPLPHRRCDKDIPTSTNPTVQ